MRAVQTVGSNDEKRILRPGVTWPASYTVWRTASTNWLTSRDRLMPTRSASNWRVYLRQRLRPTSAGTSRSRLSTEVMDFAIVSRHPLSVVGFADVGSSRPCALASASNWAYVTLDTPMSTPSTGSLNLE